LTLAPKFDSVSPMLVGYDDAMSQKEAERDRETFGPRLERVTSTKRSNMNFRCEPLLRKKLAGLTAIENGVAKAENPKAAHISDNAELHYILEEFVRGYEKLYGAIPDPDDAAAISRHVRSRTK